MSIKIDGLADYLADLRKGKKPHLHISPGPHLTKFAKKVHWAMGVATEVLGDEEKARAYLQAALEEYSAYNIRPERVLEKAIMRLCDGGLPSYG